MASRSVSTKYSYSDTFDELSDQSGFQDSAGRITCDSKYDDEPVSMRSERSSKSPETSYTRGNRLTDNSSVSDTLTYRSNDDTNNTKQEDYTDVDDVEYSDTFEESHFPTETGKSAEDVSKSYLETVRSSVDTNRESCESRSYLESVASSGITLRDSHGSKSYLESVATSGTTGEENRYLEESFESASPTYTSYDLHTYDMTESHIFGPATEEIRELSAEDLQKAEAFEARENFLNCWVGKLRESRLGPAVSIEKSRQDESRKKPESDEQRTFCRRKIQQIRKQNKHMEGIRTSVEGERTKTKIDMSPVEAYGLNSAVVDRLRLENVFKKMEQLSSEEIHDVKKCQICRKQQKKLDEAEAKKQFLKYHSCRLRSKEVDVCVENHLTRMTSLNMIREMLQDLPNLQESSDELLYQYKTRILHRMKDT